MRIMRIGTAAVLVLAAAACDGGDSGSGGYEYGGFIDVRHIAFAGERYGFSSAAFVEEATVDGEPLVSWLLRFPSLAGFGPATAPRGGQSRMTS